MKTTSRIHTTEELIRTSTTATRSVFLSSDIHADAKATAARARQGLQEFTEEKLRKLLHDAKNVRIEPAGPASRANNGRLRLTFSHDDWEALDQLRSSRDVNWSAIIRAAIRR